jgi:very-short-patch-repair endonuclease
MNDLVKGSLRNLLQKHGLRTGSDLENKVTWRLHSCGVLDQCQHRVGPYRLDYAWPQKLIALEADGPYHWHPDRAVKDVARDCFLRANGWLVFRVDDRNDNLEEQLDRVIAIIDPQPDVLIVERDVMHNVAAFEEARRLNLGDI